MEFAEISSREISKRDKNLASFLKKLEILKAESASAFDQLSSRKKDVIFFYDKQIIKLDQIFNNLLRVIEKEKNQSTGKLKNFMGSTTSAFNSFITQLDGNIKDMSFIYNDIQQNRTNILKNMETEPFNLILEKYEEKLAFYEAFSQGLYTEKLNLEKMANSSIKLYQKKIDDVLTPSIVSLFATFEVSTSFLKKDVAIESESPIPLEKNLPKYNVFPSNYSLPGKDKGENNSIYISFENKEMFENAVRNSRNVCATQVETNEISLREPLEKGSDSRDSEGKYKNSEKFENLKNLSSIFTPKSNEKCIREFSSAQPGKLMNNLNKDSFKNKRFQSTDKLQNKKYLNLLEKVNNNQNNTNVFYSNILLNEKNEKNAKNEKNEKSLKNEKNEKNDKNEKFEKNGKNEKFEKNAKNEKFEKNAKNEKIEKNEKF